MAPRSQISPLPLRLVCWLIVFGTLSYYVWTDRASFRHPPRIGDGQTDYYNLSGRGLLKGHLYLDTAVPPELIAAKNPYDPSQRPKDFSLHDVSYYHGHYYIYFGAAPVVAIFAPFYWITGQELPQAYAIGIFSMGAYGCLIGIFFWLRQRFFPNASGWTVLAGLIALSGSTMIVALLRRPATWEVAIASGGFFFFLSLLCLIRSLASKCPLAWAAAAGVAFGFAVGSRPTYALAGLLLLTPWAVETVSGQSNREAKMGWRAAIAAIAGCAVIGGLILAHNYARFGSAFEFGENYQLSSINEGQARHFSASYFLNNFYLYLIAPLRSKPWFPFVQTAVGLPYPPGYNGEEYVFGALTNLPFSLFALGALIGLRRPAPTAASESTPTSAPVCSAGLPAAIAGMLALAALLPLIPLLFFFGACIRYMADFVPALMLLACIGLFQLERRFETRRWIVGVIRFGAPLVAVVTSLVAAASVVNIYDTAALVPPVAYQPVARIANQTMAGVGRLLGQPYGPVTLKLSWAQSNRPEKATDTLLRLESNTGQTVELAAESRSSGSIRFVLRSLSTPQGVYSKDFAVGQAPHLLRVSLPELYAADDQGIVPGVAPSQSAWLGDWSLVEFDGVPAIAAFEKQRLDRIKRLQLTPNFAGESERVSSSADPSFKAFQLRQIKYQARFHLNPSLAGHTVPLVATGRAGAGDVLALKISSIGDATLLYDHWALPTVSSPVWHLRFASEHTLTFSIPAAEAADHPVLEVTLDDETKWSIPVMTYPSAWANIAFGRNSINSSICDSTFAEAKFERAESP